ncbi:MAG: helix-turn-helix transcriptional regulator, partial [Clostridia bacterium]|nr:helix-turn-helix transcriptional regulator [Clostridia bacterium]
MKVGDKIRAWRMEKGYSTEALGSKLGVSRQTVYRYESGMITNIPRDKIERMAELFGVSPMAFFGDGEEVLALKDVFPLRSHVVPMLGEIACGKPIYADEETGKYALVGD